MMPRLALACLGLLLAAANTWAAGEPVSSPAMSPLETPPKKAAKAVEPRGYLFAKPVVLRGTLGDQKIQAHVRPKADIMDGIEGDYFAFGAPQKILLAGDLSRGIFIMEESQDGRKISGRWEGRQEGDTLRGTWMSADDSVAKPFVLTVVNDKPGLRKTGMPRPQPVAP